MGKLTVPVFYLLIPFASPATLAAVFRLFGNSDSWQSLLIARNRLS
jgi:hypothetical protein